MGKAKQKGEKVKKQTETATAVTPDLFLHPSTGNYLTIAAAIVLQFVVILLPLVGPAGSVAPNAAKNFAAFLSVLLLAILLSGLAVYSKMRRRQVDGSPMPLWSPVLLAVSLFILFALFAGLLSI
jgi:hypothetical protein